jgi:hydrophobe/amphiphile efflux-1 (HAE1) family protein
MSEFFISRPIFAWVLAIVVMLAGSLAIVTLPISQYPAIAPPAIGISVSYPGASADTVQSTVVQVIEQQLSGIDNLLYFNSESDKDGSMTITLYFQQGTNADIAQVQVQNKLALATPLLPTEVQQQGIRVAKSTRNFLLVVGFFDENNKLSSGDISDFIASSIQDPLARTAGVGDYQLFGSQYAMRIWMDPAKLNNFQLTPVDIAAAINSQNVQVASGELGGLPSVKGQMLNVTIIGPQRLQTREEFGAILLKTNTDGSQVRLRDVARITLGSEQYQFANVLWNGHPAAGIAVKLATGANALDASNAIHATMERLKPTFPAGLQAIYPNDSTPFIRISIEDVVKTLFEAIGLVFLVMLLFLQNIRATFIPTIAVPVVLLGTFGILKVAGYSINVLTMFAMVLAIGLLVDDAIVVVENVERVMDEENLSPKEATRKSMKQITGALVGIALVLSAVFLPMAFFGGSTGVIYRQFSITMVSAMALSVLVALTFTPALCATLLKKRGEAVARKGFFGWFNRTFERANKHYENSVVHLLARTGRYMLIFVGIVVLMGVLFVRIPSSFLPDEDQGIMFGQVTAPPGSTTERTEKSLAEIRDYFLNEEKDSVMGVFTISGFNFAARGQAAGFCFVRMKDWKDRPGAKFRIQAVAARANAHFRAVADAQAFVFVPPAALELGNATGFDLELLDRTNQGHAKLMSARDELLKMARGDHRMMQVRPNGLDDEPQYQFKVDWEKATTLGLTIDDINNTLSAAWGSQYVDQFVDRGRVKRVFIQGDAPSRMLPDDLNNWYVRNPKTQLMVPFSAFSSAVWGYGSPKLERYNGVPAVEILGGAAPGVSTGTILKAMEEYGAKLPAGFELSWTGLSFEEKLSGSQAPALYAISLVVVFLCLAALYESWSIPVAVMLVVPLGVIGAILATLFRGLANDVFFQVGLLTTVGLSAKNAILIVEFAKENHDQGMDIVEATVHAARQRLRPILMTSLAFVLGVMPLALSSGAGSGGQNAIGTGVIGGMLSATFLAIFFVPVFFVSVLRLFKGTNSLDQRKPEKQS